MIQTPQLTTKLPGTAADGGGPNAWSNPSNALTDNGSSASWGATGGGAQSNEIQLTNFGFALPSNAVIDGVSVTVDRTQFSAYSTQFRLYNTTLTGTNKDLLATLNPTFGGYGDLWGLALTPAIINGSDFGVKISAADISGGDATLSIDYVSITVFWHYDVTVPAANVALRYDYKVYDPDGQYLGNLPNVVSEYETVQDMNSSGAELNIDVAGTPDGQMPAIVPGGLTRWLPGDWAYRQRIVVRKEKVSGDQGNIALLVDLSDMGSLFWANLVSSTGADIRVTTSNGVTELPFELVGVSKTSKIGELWFKADIIKTLYDTPFYIYFGSPTASAYADNSVYGADNVWNIPTTMLVAHLQTNGADSTSFNHTATSSGSPSHAAGALIGNGVTLDGTNDYIDFGGGTGTVDSDMATLADGVIVVKFWIKRSSTQAGEGNIFSINSSDGATNKLLIGFQASGTALSIWKASDSVVVATPNITDGVPHHIVVIVAGNNLFTYVDGELYYNVTGGATISLASGDFWALGAERNSGPVVANYGAAQIDELRIEYGISGLSAALSAHRQRVSYRNQVDPTAFYRFDYMEDGATYNHESALIRNGNNINVWETSYYYPNGKLMYRGQINRVKGRQSADVDPLIHIKCHSDGRDLDSYPARGGPFTYTNDQAQETGDSSFLVTRDTGYNQCGQSWIAGVGVPNIANLQFALGGAASVTVAVYDGPNGEFLGSATKDVNVPYATVVGFQLDFIEADPGHEYFAGISVGVGQSIQVYYKAGSNPYANGSMYTASYAGGSGGGGYGISANNDLWFKVDYGTPNTAALYEDQDPFGDMLPAVMTDYNDRGGMITLGENEDTGLSLDIELNVNTVYEAIKKFTEASPANSYWYVDLGSNELIAKRTGSTADHLFVYGRHVGELELDFSIENVVNDLLFSGGEVSPGVNLYSEYLSPTSKRLYQQRLDRKSDNRVTLQPTANSVGESNIKEREDEQQYTAVSILAKTMDITLFKPGQLVGFRAYKNYINGMLLQIVRIRYTGRQADMILGTLPIRYSTDYEQTVRSLIAEQTVNNPNTPTS